MRVIDWVLAAVILGGLGGCCPCARVEQRGALPAALTVDEQARRLAEWSRHLPGIKARTVIAGVRLDYRDENGQGHTLNAEGLLQIRQHTGEPTAAADVLLQGKSIDKEVFEAGRNAKWWWYARMDTKRALVGDATRPLDLATLGGKDSASILRADLVPDLLGLSELPGTAINPNGTPETGGGPLLMMLVNDAAGTNDLYIGQMSRDRRPYLSREMIVDRYSGHVTEVRLYDPSGVVVVRSELSAYMPVTYDAGAGGVAKPTGVVMFPKKVVVSYPGEQMKVSLEFEEVRVMGAFKSAVFETPGFEGLKIISAD